MNNELTLEELKRKASELEIGISMLINNFHKETRCDVEVDVYLHEAVGLRNVYVVKVKVKL